jgi:GNAT superfamily N-acetyltransferase
MAIEIIPVTDQDGAIVEAGWLAKAEPVHRELRPQIPADYAAKMRAVFAGGGRMAIAAQGDRAVGVAVYRAYEDTFNGRKFYCDDLVTTERERSTGVGHALMRFMEREAMAYRCTAFALDSGVQRREAHKFYFREGMFVVSFNFKKDMSR